MKSLRGAIDAKCRECIYDPVGGHGTWRQQVTLCTVYNCSLYEVRPLAEAVPDKFLEKVRCNPKKMDARSRALIVASDHAQEDRPRWQDGRSVKLESTSPINTGLPTGLGVLA